MQIINLVEFKTLVKKWVANEISNEEIVRLYQLLSVENSREILADALMEISEEEVAEQQEDRDWDAIYAVISQSVKKKDKSIWKSWLPYISAAMLLLIGAFSYFLLRDQSIQDPQAELKVFAIPNSFQIKDESGKSLSFTSFTEKSKINDFAIVDEVVKVKTELADQVRHFTIENPVGAAPVKLLLVDSSLLVINAGSWVTFPNKFDGTVRSVTMSGEVQFQVKKQNRQPFVVHANELSIDVLGTTFNVESYEKEEFITTTLLEGKVRVTDKSGSKLSLIPGEQAVYNLGNKELSKRKIDAENVLSWKNGTLFIEDESLLTVLKKIERIYNVQCVFNSDYKDVNIWGSLTIDQELKDILPILEKVSGVNLKLDGRTIYINQKK